MAGSNFSISSPAVCFNRERRVAPPGLSGRESWIFSFACLLLSGEMRSMETRTLGKTGLKLPVLSFGASSLGQEFRPVTLEEALRSVRAALDCGMTLIDTSPFYGRGMSEVLLGVALRGVPRESYLLCTKLGRYDLTHFDFSAKRVAESVDVSLHRLGTDHLDIILCHDIEFVKMQQIVDETIPALRSAQKAGKARFIGFSGYPMKVFRFVLDQTEDRKSVV